MHNAKTHEQQKSTNIILVPIKISFFGSASTQTLLMHMVSTTGYNGHLNKKRSIAKWHIKTTLLRPMYSLQAGEFIPPGFNNNIVTKHDVESHYTSLAFNGYAHFWYSCELYVVVTLELNPMP